MRILVLLGLGLPVVAVSGAVAYGSVSQISHSFKAHRAPAVVAETVPARPSEAAHNFVLAAAGSWEMTPEAALEQRAETPSLENLLGRDEAGNVQARGANTGPERPEVTNAPPEAPELNVAVVTERPITVAPQVVRPRVVVSADRRPAQGVREQRTNQNRKREFRMPWQTGVFQ
jgi:hypothetical protein